MVEAMIEPPLRPRLPAYGKALLLERRLGNHPREITVIYGDNWRGVKHPRLGVRPLQYQPGLVDWRMVAGVMVTLIDRAEGLAEFDIAGNHFGKFYALIAELAAMDAYVQLMYPDGAVWARKDAGLLAYECRHERRWPCWWSDGLERRQQAAFLAYSEDSLRLTGCDKGGDVTTQ